LRAPSHLRAPMAIELKSERVADLAHDDMSRLVLETEMLPAYIGTKRWYAAKGKTPPRVKIDSIITVPAVSDGAVLILAVGSENEPASRYLFPITLKWEGDLPRTGVVGEVRIGSAAGWIVDGFDDDDFVGVLLNGIRTAGGGPETRSGLVFWRSSAFDIDPPFSGEDDIRRSGAEQSNTSVIAGRAILKAFRKLEPGVHPELEVGRFLTEVASFPNVPRLLGSIEHVASSDGTRTALCVLQSLIRDAEDGWEHVTDRLGHLSNRSGSDSDLIGLAQRLGQRTAELHHAFAVPTDNPDFAPDPVSKDWLSRWADAVLRSLESVSEKARSSENHSDSNRRLLGELAARKNELAERIRALIPKTMNASLTRLHGDFHLGQILVANDDVIIVDFEGEPMRPLADRRQKHLPLRDIAGMLRSFDYARAATVRNCRLAETEALSLREITSRMQSSFLSVYAQAIAGCASFPEDLAQADDVLEFCLIEKSMYEVLYEISNRPDWVNIPVVGLLGILDGKRNQFQRID
jgi:trehalose synthase-fused probable maltokinase